MKNAYFNIGGYELSLYEIENCILTQGLCSKSIYGEVPKFSDSDPRNILVIDKVQKYINYGISIPTTSSPPLKIYFPNTISELLKLNTIDYYSNKINIDLDSYILAVPEFATWIDDKFYENIANYDEYILFFNSSVLSFEFAEFLKMNKNILSMTLCKYDWTLNFSNFNQ